MSVIPEAGAGISVVGPSLILLAVVLYVFAACVSIVVKLVRSRRARESRVVRL